jgi:hypothetical protein
MDEKVAKLMLQEYYKMRILLNMLNGLAEKPG